MYAAVVAPAMTGQTSAEQQPEDDLEGREPKPAGIATRRKVPEFLGSPVAARRRRVETRRRAGCSTPSRHATT